MTEDRNCAWYLELFITNKIAGLIVHESNCYAKQFLTRQHLSQVKWKELKLEELNVFLAIIIAQGRGTFYVFVEKSDSSNSNLHRPRTVCEDSALFDALKFTYQVFCLEISDPCHKHVPSLPLCLFFLISNRHFLHQRIQKLRNPPWCSVVNLMFSSYFACVVVIMCLLLFPSVVSCPALIRKAAPATGVKL